MSEELRLSRVEAERLIDERWQEFQDRYGEQLLDEMKNLAFPIVPRVADDGSITQTMGPEFYQWIQERNTRLAVLAIESLFDTLYGSPREPLL
jgi:hypothetical protein